MSLSLSSLLNPSPDADTQQQQHASSSSPSLTRKDSLPPIQYVQSPVQDATSPHSAQFPPSAESNALHALAAISSNTAPLPTTQSQWHSQSGQPYERSSGTEQRPGSSGMQLPPPNATMERKMSSPTLEQYHVASRSPQERRQSFIAPVQSHVVLPPIRDASHPDQVAHSSAASEHVMNDTTHSPTAFTSREQRPPPADLSQLSLPPNPYATDAPASSPTHIKQETLATPRASSPADAQQTPPMKQSDAGMDSVKAIASLKNEHGLRNQSPLRESSVPVPSTEIPTPEPTVPKKRPAPSKTKKGTATVKKAPPAKKRKVEPKRSVTPSSRASKPPTFKTSSSKGTPANSSPAPSTRSQSVSADEEAYDEDEDEGPAGSDDELYCICRKPDNGTFMIGCDGTCDDWFHGKCVGIEESKKHLIDKYICPQCTKAGVGQTTWKRMCRRSGCKQAAKIGKTKNGKEGSKYCSDECGVLFFRDMLARSRGKEDMAKHRSSRRKNSIVSQDHTFQDDDLGARGGVLAAGELKALVNTSKTASDFKKLGEGVLSPPSTPDANSPSSTKKSAGSEFTESETKTLQGIASQKDDARRKHNLLKERMKFVQMAKQAASRTATERELKPKEYCGYDSRIEWTDEQFALWRASKAGQQAFELDTLSTEVSSSPKEKETPRGNFNPADAEVEVLLRGVEICERKKCARHLEWPKLAIDDVRFEMGDNGDRMRGLDREEKDVRERAALRAKKDAGRSEGRVELHGLGVDMGDRMEVDAV